MINPNDLDDFTKAYCVAALWSENDENGEPLDSKYGIINIDDNTIQEMIADCKQFQADNKELLQQAYELYVSRDGTSPESHAGHDCLLTRNHHALGYWDRPELDENEIGNKLTKASQAFKEYNLAVNGESVTRL